MNWMNDMIPFLILFILVAGYTLCLIFKWRKLKQQHRLWIDQDQAIQLQLETHLVKRQVTNSMFILILILMWGLIWVGTTYPQGSIVRQTLLLSAVALFVICSFLQIRELITKKSREAEENKMRTAVLEKELLKIKESKNVD